MQCETSPAAYGKRKEHESSFHRDTYHYVLPARLIAQQPLPRRDASRLMVLCRAGRTVWHAWFREIHHYLQEGDLLVVNDSKVFPARILGRKPSGGRVDLLLLRPLAVEDGSLSWFGGNGSSTREWNCLIRCSSRPRAGQILSFPGGLEAEVIGGPREGLWQVRLNMGGTDLLRYLDRHGLTPLPPYIRRSSPDSTADRERYQTVFAREVGSVAAPTAGLHFTESLRKSLESSGIRFAGVTLHVNQATFLPIRKQDIRQHRMGAERYHVSEQAAEEIRRAKGEGRRVIAVGTTVVRCLESCFAEKGGVEPGHGWAGLYIVPGHRFRVVDGLITNFHLPKTSLLVLVCAFAGRLFVLRAYEEAVRREYRFFSYGDCMLIM